MHATLARPRRLLAALTCAGATVAGATTTGAGDSPAAAASAPPSHHRPQGFQNNDVEFAPKSLRELIAWKWNALREGLPRPPSTPTPVVAPDLGFIHANARAGAAMQPAVTWIGHATVLAQLGGLNVLTDPIFAERASPVGFAGPKRHVAPGLSLAQLPHVDLVLVSHNHYDHQDEPSLRALAAQPGGAPLFVVPLGNKAWFTALGLTHVVELDWWQSHRVGAVEVVLTPVQHWTARGLGDQLATLWGGYALLAPDFHLFFAGDTAYSKDFSRIRQHFAARQGSTGFDLAILPIGGYEPRWFMAPQHVNPAEAVQIHLDLAARQSLGMHWGTFELTDEPLDEPPRALVQARADKGLADTAFFVTAIGETRRLARRAP